MFRAVVAWISAGAMLAAATPGFAQPVAWKPERNVEIISSVAVGGGTDATARLVQRLLREQGLAPGPSTVVNKPAGGGAETWAYLESHAGDGHHLAISTPPLLTIRILGADTPTPADYTPITILYSEYVLVAVRADSPIRTGKDLAERLKRDPASISVAVAPALGSHNHLVPALVAKNVGSDPKKMRVEVYATGAAAADAALEGRADIVSSTVGTLLAYVQSGKLRPLALTVPRRLGGPLATIPTWHEHGIAVELPAWRGVIGPRGMPAEQVAYWEDTFLKLSLDSQWLTELSKRWWEGTYLNSTETRKFMDQQFDLLRGTLSELGLVK